VEAAQHLALLNALKKETSTLSMLMHVSIVVLVKHLALLEQS
jgi:hypothetical protein